MVFLFHQNLVADHIKFLNIQEGLSFFTRIWLQTLSKFRTYKMVFLLHQNLVADSTKIQNIQEGLSFSKEFGCRSYRISGHTVGSFFFTRIWLQIVPNFRTYSRVFLFHQNLGQIAPNFRTYNRVFLFQQNLVADLIKI